MNLFTVTPDINEKWSSGNKVVKEGESVQLHCNATGVPQPVIQWFRKSDGQKDCTYTRILKLFWNKYHT